MGTKTRWTHRALTAGAVLAGLGTALAGCTTPAPGGGGGPVPTSPPPTVAPRPGPPAGARTFAANPYTGIYKGQCTDYALERMHQQTGRYPAIRGDAWEWGGLARQAGWTVGTQAAVNSLAVFPRNAFSSPPGHVGWVEDVRNNQLRITDYNWNHRVGQITDHWVTVPAGTVYIYSDR
jgi:surface antigen